MATYAELAGLPGTPEYDSLLGRVQVACTIAADIILNEDPGTANHANRLKWAARTFQNPRRVAEEIIPALLAANAAASISQITGATDSGVQNAVDDAVDLFATTLFS